MSLHSERKLIPKLRNRKFRSAYVSSRINNFLAFQIRALRQKKKWSQVELAKKLGTSQNAVSRMENPSYGKHSITTLKRLGEMFDVGIVVWFVPFSELIQKTVNLSTENIIIPSFVEEFGTTEQVYAEIKQEGKKRSEIIALTVNLSPGSIGPSPKLSNYIRDKEPKPGGFFKGGREILQRESLGGRSDRNRMLSDPEQAQDRTPEFVNPSPSATGSQRMPLPN